MHIWPHLVNLSACGEISENGDKEQPTLALKNSDVFCVRRLSVAEKYECFFEQGDLKLECRKFRGRRQRGTRRVSGLTRRGGGRIVCDRGKDAFFWVYVLLAKLVR